MNLFKNWIINFQGLSSFGKIAYWTKSVSEERDRYNRCPCEGAFSNALFTWQHWKAAGCRTPSETDAEGYD
jgi:hypothetical protein